jgi:hypothetical protein
MKLGSRPMLVVKLCYNLQNGRLFMQQFITKIILILTRRPEGKRLVGLLNWEVFWDENMMVFQALRLGGVD